MRNMKSQKPLVEYNILLTIFDTPMKSIENVQFPKTEFETVFCQILNPDCHGVLRSLRKLVTRVASTIGGVKKR